MSELDLPQIAESQALAYITSNDADARLEQALCATQIVTVPTTGDVSLSAAQFQTAWHFDLRGTPGGPFALILPAIKRPFMIRNQSGMTVTVKIGAGAAVPVLSTETRMLYSDGTNVWGLSDTANTGGGTGAVSQSGALVSLSADRSLARLEDVLIDWGTERYDTGGFYDSSSNTERFTIPSGVSKVIVSSQLRWDTSQSGWREILAYKNGSAEYDGRAYAHLEAQSGHSVLSFQSPVLPVVAGDYFEVYATHSASSNRTVYNHVASWFSIQAVG